MLRPIQIIPFIRYSGWDVLVERHGNPVIIEDNNTGVDISRYMRRPAGREGAALLRSLERALINLPTFPFVVALLADRSRLSTADGARLLRRVDLVTATGSVSNPTAGSVCGRTITSTTGVGP